MKAILCHEWGGREGLRFEEVAPVTLGPTQARIRVRACGVNFADTLMIAGKYQVKPEFPFTPGLEAAGDVVEVGREVTHLHAGQRVLAVLRFGGPRPEEILLHAAPVLPIPHAMDYLTPAPLPVVYGPPPFGPSPRRHP